MHYDVKSLGNRNFEVFTENNDSIGNLHFDFWAIKKARITLTNGLSYLMAASGFWQSTVQVMKDESIFAEIKPVWANGGLQVTFNSSAQSFTFKKKSWLSTDHKLVDEQDYEIATVNAFFKWKTFRNDYTVDISHNTFDRETNIVLPLLLVYCSYYLRMRHSTGGA